MQPQEADAADLGDELDLPDELTGPVLIQVRPALEGEFGVFTILKPGHAHQEEVCRRCPWRTDAPIGAFPPDVFRSSARTSYDMSRHMFGCHNSKRDEPLTCAGFLLRGAANNRAVRLALIKGRIDLSKVHSPVELYTSYREMAVANGVDPDDPALARCRDDSAFALPEAVPDNPASNDPGAQDDLSP